jgi:hypothetical protein
MPAPWLDSLYDGWRTAHEDLWKSKLDGSRPYSTNLPVDWSNVLVSPSRKEVAWSRPLLLGILAMPDDWWIEWEGLLFVMSAGVWRPWVTFGSYFGAEPLLLSNVSDDYYREARECWTEHDAGDRRFWLPRAWIKEDLLSFTAKIRADVVDYERGHEIQQNEATPWGTFLDTFSVADLLETHLVRYMRGKDEQSLPVSVERNWL